MIFMHHYTKLAFLCKLFFPICQRTYNHLYITTDIIMLKMFRLWTYRPIVYILYMKEQLWRISESNRWPSACKADALANWANPPSWESAN